MSHNGDSATLYAVWSKNSYTVTISLNGTGLSSSASSVSVQYGGTNTATITPSSGYKISAASCTNGYTLSPAASGQTSATTFTISNNSKTSASTCTFTGEAATFHTTCQAASSDSTFTWNNTQYVKLQDGNCWTKNSVKTKVLWVDRNGSCPSGTSVPPKSAFDTLISQYGSGGGLYNATNWSSTYYWTDTERVSGSWSYYLYVTNSTTNVGSYGSMNDKYDVLCYGR